MLSNKKTLGVIGGMGPYAPKYDFIDPIDIVNRNFYSLS